jgi:hypothetical protein
VTLKGDDERRHTQRFALPKSAPATFGGCAAEIVEISLIGCQIKHVDRITPRAGLPLRFKWRGKPVGIDATVMRSEMRSIGGKPAYMSGLVFCESAEESPAVIREIVGWLAAAAKSDAHEEPATESPAAAATVSAPSVEASVEHVPFLGIADDDEVEVVAAPYLQCRLTAGTWSKLYVEKPEQPKDGFTIVAPSDDAEVDVLCRAYQAASVLKRSEMRASFELAIAQNRRRRG